MILGQVNSRIEAIIPVMINNNEQNSVIIDAIIDTGFSGFLSLPSTAISTLKLPFFGSRIYSLGNNQQANFDIYLATIIWDGQERVIQLLSSEAHPLVGMLLLKGFRLTIDALDGGEVRIESKR